MILKSFGGGWRGREKRVSLLEHDRSHYCRKMRLLLFGVSLGWKRLGRVQAKVKEVEVIMEMELEMKEVLRALL